MIARYPGTCACCGAAFHAGAQVERRGSGWVRASCLNRPATASGAEPSGQFALVLQVLAQARAVAAHWRARLASWLRSLAERANPLRGAP